MAACYLTVGIVLPAQSNDGQWICGFVGHYSIPPEVGIPVSSPAACLAFCQSKVPVEGYGPLELGEYFCSTAGNDRFCGYGIDWAWSWNDYSWVCDVIQRNPQNYVIKLSRVDGSSEDSTTLDKAEPSRFTNLIARVYDQNNQVVPNVNLRLEAEVVGNSGGHQHDDPARHSVHTGQLGGGTVTQNGRVLAGDTGIDGLRFTFKAPAPAGDHKITVTCTDRTCNQEGPDKVWVGVKGLVSLYETHLYMLVGSDDVHPNNHYLTPAATGSVVWLAELYRARFPNDPALHLNDASLERGGLFDIKHDRRTQWWTPPHTTHRRGIDIDVRANEFVHADAMPHRNYFDFEEIAIKVGCSADMHSEFTRNQHYHMTCG